MKNNPVDTVTNNENDWRRRIFEGDLPAADGMAELLRIEREQHDVIVEKLKAERDEWFREAEDRANSCSIILRRAEAAEAQVAKLREDAARLDWLEHMTVNVRTPLVHGSSDLFWASPGREDDDPSNLREQIDTARKGTAP